MSSTRCVQELPILRFYRDNGAQYVGALARARITVEQRANAAYLRVTTAAPINEPFLNLIIELSWATGRVVRDYTFLLDPPGATEMQAIEPAAPIRPEAATRTTRAGRRAAEAAASAGATLRGARYSGQLYRQAWRHPVQDRHPVQA